MGLGSAMAGGNPQTERQKRDWYPTPDDVTRSFLAVEKFTGSIHECACGDGAMAEVIREFGFEVVATDLEPQNYGFQQDFFEIGRPLAENIITNPPFNLAARFIEHGLDVLRPKKMALVLKATYWHAARRTALFQRTRPSKIYALTWRPDFLGKGAPTMDICWTVWDQDHIGPTEYHLLERNPHANASRQISIF